MTHSFSRICSLFLIAIFFLTLSGCSDRESRKPIPRPTGATVQPDRPVAPSMAGQRALPPVEYAKPGQTIKIGLLLPLSGESAKLGKTLQDAAVMALFDKYATISPPDIKVNVILVPKDTGANNEMAMKAAKEALDEGVKLIIGPVFGTMVPSVAPLARAKNVPLITFSNNRQIAGDGVYLFGFMPEQQVKRVVEFAVKQNVTRIGALLPQNSYGTTVQKTLGNALDAQQLRASPLEFYPPQFVELDAQLKRLASVHARPDYPQGYHALMIGEGGNKLQVIINGLAANGVHNQNTQFLGTGLWDDDEIFKVQGLYGGWFASSLPSRYNKFRDKFVRQYDYEPVRLASLSYDAVALAASLAMAPGGPDFSESALTDPIGFSGPANGIFRFHSTGICERGLSVLSVTPSGFKVIDPAPEFFGG